MVPENVHTPFDNKREGRFFMRNRTYCGAAALILTLTLCVCTLADYAAACAGVRQGVLRLHITADSDAPEAQEVKLKVRDALLENGAEIFDGSVTAAEAEEKLEPYLADIEKTADAVLKENGCGYTARAYIVNEYFAAREYDGITLPAGRYTALRVALGTGEGKNWWCVMFPPLCLPAAAQPCDEAFAVFAGEGEHVVKAEKGYKVRFKLVELAERVLEKLREPDSGRRD